MDPLQPKTEEDYQPVFINRNIDGKWQKVEITSSEVRGLTSKCYSQNLRLVKRCLESFDKLDFLKSRDQELKNSLLCLLVEKMTTPLHYFIENYVDDKLKKEESSL